MDYFESTWTISGTWTTMSGLVKKKKKNYKIGGKKKKKKNYNVGCSKNKELECRHVESTKYNSFKFVQIKYVDLVW